MKYLSKQSKRPPAGYSLIELIVVLVLIGTISAVVTPLFISTIFKTRMKTSAKNLATTFRYARSQAINTKKPYYFYIDLDNSSYWISSDIENEESEVLFDAEEARKAAVNVRKTSREIVIKKVEVGLSTIEEGVVEIPFYPQGSTIDTNVYLEKRNGSNSDKKFEIHLDEITGKVKLVKK